MADSIYIVKKTPSRAFSVSFVAYILMVCMGKFYDEKTENIIFNWAVVTISYIKWNKITGHTLWNQLLLEFSVYPFKTLWVC